MVLPSLGAVDAATSATGSVRAVVGHLLEAAPVAAPAGALAWTSGKSNVQAVWSFLPPAGTGDLAQARQGGAPMAPLELRTARDLTLMPLTRASHPGCSEVNYRGAFLLHGRLVPYEVCDAATEIYVAAGADMREADSALAVTAAVPGRAATREAFEVTLDGTSYVFAGAPASSAVTLRQGRLVAGLGDGERVELTPMGMPSARVVLHDVVAPAKHGAAAIPLLGEFLAMLAQALP